MGMGGKTARPRDEAESAKGALRVMVCVTGQKTCERLIHEGARIAREIDGEVKVVHVATGGAPFMGVSPAQEAEALEYLFRRAQECGADMEVVRADSAVDALCGLAMQHDVDCVVLGAARGRGAQDFAEQLRSRLPRTDVRVVIDEG